MVGCDTTACGIKYSSYCFLVMTFEIRLIQVNMKNTLFKSCQLIGAITISLASLGQTTFSKHSISSPNGPIDTYTSDVNSDGWQDILTITYPAGEVSWWENNGLSEFTKHVIKATLPKGRSLRAGDIDSDGDIDVIATGIEANRIEWYENNGSQSFTTHVITNNFTGAHTVQLVDLDQDSDMDVLCSGWDNSSTKSEVAWWENNGSQSFTKHLVSNTMDQSPFISSADFDSDGDLDLVVADEVPGEVYWFQNDGNMAFEMFTIDESFSSAHTLNIGDLDLDGDQDIMVNAWTGGQAWYKNDGQGVFEKQSLPSLSGAMWIDMADLDMDGDNDIIAVGSGSTRIALYNNDGNQRFSKQNTSGTISSGFGLSIADLDNDIDLDIVAVGFQSNTLAWWENELNLQSLLNGPAWIVPGKAQDEFFVSNPENGNIVCCNDLEPKYGIASGGYKEGILVKDGFIWVTSGPMLNKYDLESGVILEGIRSETQLLSSITSDPDGVAYITAPLDGKVFSFNPDTKELNLISSNFDFPFAVRYYDLEGELIVLDGEETVTIKTLNTETGEAQIQNVTQIAAGGDIVPDGKGNYYLSSTPDNRIYTFLSGLDGIPNIFAEDLQGPWGLLYDALNLEIVVVMNTDNSLERIPATATGIRDITVDSELSITATFDQGGALNLRFKNCNQGKSKVFFVSLNGHTIREQDFEVGPDRNLELSWPNLKNGCNLARGIYIIGISSGDKLTSRKIFVQ